MTLNDMIFANFITGAVYSVIIIIVLLIIMDKLFIRTSKELSADMKKEISNHTRTLKGQVIKQIGKSILPGAESGLLGQVATGLKALVDMKKEGISINSLFTDLVEDKKETDKTKIDDSKGEWTPEVLEQLKQAVKEGEKALKQKA